MKMSFRAAVDGFKDRSYRGMPAKSVKQQQAAGIALAAERGDIPKSKLRGSSAEMAKSMGQGELRKFAHTSHKGLPPKKSLVGMNTQGTANSIGYPTPKACMSLEAAANAIVDQVLEEEDDERAETDDARTILNALHRLQTSLPEATPEQTHDISIIRAAANSLLRMHGA